MYTDGISSNYTFDVYKDKQGRVWVGTQNGITLIDGSITKKYGVAHGLPSADIIKITDINGRLFAATSGQGVYVLENDTFESKVCKRLKCYHNGKYWGQNLYIYEFGKYYV